MRYSRSRLRTIPIVTSFCLGFPFTLVPTSTSSKFDRKLTFEGHVRGIVSRVSQRIGILRFVKLGVFVDTSVLLRCCYAFVLYIL